VQLQESTCLFSPCNLISPYIELFSQLLVCGRYPHDKGFMLCQPLLATTSAVDVIKLVDQYCEKIRFTWKNLIIIYADSEIKIAGLYSWQGIKVFI